MTKENFDKAESALLKVIGEISAKEQAANFSDRLNATIYALIYLDLKRTALVSP